MTVFNLNNRPAARTWNGLVNDLFADFEKSQPNYSSQPNGKIPVNIKETENAYQLELAAPGRNKANFSLNVEKNSLTISYDEKTETENQGVKSIRTEFLTPSFKRTFILDEKVNAEQIEARYDNGILILTLPKKAEVKPEVKQISVQ
ncbi:MAG: Hsp20/alpha crystallin family protein [Bacteroidota bacterium]